MGDSENPGVCLVVRKAKQGDQAAMARLIRDHSTLAYRVAYAIVGNRQDAEDAVQEAFMRVCRAIHQVRDEAAFRTWVTRIAANQARDLLRRRNLQRGLPERLPPDDTFTEEAADTGVLRQETSDEVRKAIRLLSPLQRATVFLYYSDEFTTNEVAVLLGKPAGSVRRLLSDAYRSLRRLLQPALERSGRVE